MLKFKTWIHVGGGPDHLLPESRVRVCVRTKGSILVIPHFFNSWYWDLWNLQKGSQRSPGNLFWGPGPVDFAPGIIFMTVASFQPAHYKGEF